MKHFKIIKGSKIRKTNTQSHFMIFIQYYNHNLNLFIYCTERNKLKNKYSKKYLGMCWILQLTHSLSHTHTTLSAENMQTLQKRWKSLRCTRGFLKCLKEVWVISASSSVSALSENPDRRPTSQLHVSQDFWTSFRCFDRNAILRFLDLCVYLRKTVLTTHICCASAQRSKLHSDSSV